MQNKITIYSLVHLVACGPKAESFENDLNQGSRSVKEVQEGQNHGGLTTVPDLVETHPYDPAIFTQGLEFNQAGDLIISSGLYGESFIGSFDLNSGKVKLSQDLDEEYFAEGLTHTDRILWVLTWQEEQAFALDPKSHEVLTTVPYQGQGWGTGIRQ